MDEAVQNKSQEGEQSKDFSALSQWQSISPIAILYFVENTLKFLLGNIVFLIAPVVVAYEQLSRYPLYAISGLFILLLMLFVYAACAYYFYQFRVAEDSVEIRAGVFAKKHLNLPFTRIQNISIEQPFYFRITHFVCLQLDTAGSAKQEAKIVALPFDVGHQLKHYILKNRESTTLASENRGAKNGVSGNGKDIVHDALPGDAAYQENAAVDLQSSVNERVLNRRSLPDLILHGITNNRVWILLGALVPFYDSAATMVTEYLVSHGVDLKAMFSDQSLAWWQLGLYAFSITMLLMLVLILFSIIGSILMFYGYTLSKDKDRYIRRSGLITRQEISIKLSRLQLIVRKQDWLDCILGRINLKFEQNNSGIRGDNALDNQNSLIVPSVKELECQALIHDALPENQLHQVHFNSISFRFFLRNFALYIVPVFGGLLAVSLFAGKAPESIAVSIGLLISSLLVFCRWKRWGYAIDKEFIYIRKGLLGVDYYCFPIFKVQQTKFSQSYFMKRRKLASCQIVLACGGQLIPFIPESLCRQLNDYCLFKAEKEKRSWM